MEDVFPALVVVPPPLAVQYERALRGVRKYQAVHYVVKLTTEATALEQGSG